MAKILELTDQNIELVLVDAEMGDELSRVFVNPDELDDYDVGIAYKHQHETAKWSVYVLASDFDSDSDVLNIEFVR
tara:strand:- start:469 stop:696 length:228 start_codon:yes stop_codon:yes gene_type:complete